MKQIIILAAFSILAGCSTTDHVQAQMSEAEENSISSEYPEKVDELLTIRATGNVYVLVRDRTTSEELYKNTMEDGENASLKIEGAVDVLFTAGEHLTFERNGEKFRPNTKGTAKITID